MEQDKRYQPVNAVPQSLLEKSDVVHSPGFSIKGQLKEGRPAYLDFQATTPLDPRVLDAMVCDSILWSVYRLLASFHGWKIWKSSFSYSFLWMGN